jgi:FlgD Ig-like domain
MRRVAAPRSAFLVASILSLSLLGLAVPALAAGPITSGQTVTGALAGPSFGESWTFTGAIGQRVVITAVTTGGSANTNIRLINPSSAEVVNTSTDRVEYQCTANGTYTITIEDLGLNDVGNYSLTFLNVTGGPLTSGPDPDGGATTSASIKTGQFNAASDMDAFTFSGTAGDHILIGGITTGGTANTTLTLYPPGGGAAETYTSSGDRLDWALLKSGTYTVVIEDYSDLLTGTYSLSFLNLTAGPLTSGTDADGGTIASAEVKSGQAQAVGDFDAYRFTGFAGSRVIVTAITTAGTMNTNISVYPPSGAALVGTSSDRNELQLPTDGTYTIVIEDLGQNDTGTYSLTMLNLNGALTTATDTDGGLILPAEVRTGSFNVAPDMDAYTFSAIAGDHILCAAVTTGGAANTTLTLYPPSGGAAESYTSSGDQLDWTVLSTGTYTVVVEDYSELQTGTYSLSYVNLTNGPISTAADPDGGTIVSAEVKTGQANAAADYDVYRFTGNAGERVLLEAITTTGAMNSNVVLYPPIGPSLISTSTDRNEVQLPMSGTYTIVVSDLGVNDTGTYKLTMLDLAGPLTSAADTDGGAIVSGDPKTGQAQTAPDFDAYTFTGAAGGHVLFAAVMTAGAMNTTMTLYPPSGGPAEAYTSSGDRLDWTLLTSGTYKLVVEDYNGQNTGGYAVSMINLTAGPLTGTDLDGGTITSGQVKTGTATSVADFDAYRFDATAGDRIIGSAITTAGAMNTNISVFPPFGAAIVNSSSDRFDVAAPATGTYTMVIEDLGDNDLGSYAVSLLDLNGPLTTASDTDGGPLTSSEVRNGQFQAGGPDFDAFTFSGLAGERVLVGAITTGGVANTTITAYPPGGGVAEAYTSSGDRLDWTLLNNGKYTVVIEPYTQGDVGTYTASLLDLQGGALTSPSDANGGPIAPGQTKNGTISTTPDFDGWQFFGTVGDTVRITTTATSGTLNTNTLVYPPYGPPIANTSTDVVPPFVLISTGIHTIVVEDLGLTHTGNYTLQFQKTGAVVGAPLPAMDLVLRLMPPRPNPFSSEANVLFSLPRELPVRVRVFDVGGALVRTLANETMPGGVHSLRWNGRDESGAGTASGIYYVELTAGGESVRTKIVRMR